MKMDWMNQLGGLLGQYQNQQSTHQNVEQDFDRFAQNAPNTALAEGLGAAFRSNQTPAFGNMVAQLFGGASGYQRAGLLNTLLAAAGPMVMQQVMQRMSNRGAAAGGNYGSQTGGGLGGVLESLRGGGQPQITPEVAEQMSPEDIQEIAAAAEQQDPSIVDRISDYASQNPDVVKGLGAVALTVALSHLANQYMNRR